MNKTELIEKIAAKAQLTKADAKKALDAATEAIKEALVAGDGIQLIGFGTFSVNERPAREGDRLRDHQPVADPTNSFTGHDVHSFLRGGIAPAPNCHPYGDQQQPQPL